MPLSSISEQFPWISVLLFVVVWVVIMKALARFGGWEQLAGVYATDTEIEGHRWLGQSAIMRYRVSYNNCLNFRANYRGLSIRPFVFFRIGHPALFIPWSDITVTGETGRFIYRVVNLRFSRAPEIPFRISARLAQKIQDATGHSLKER